MNFGRSNIVVEFNVHSTMKKAFVSLAVAVRFSIYWLRNWTVLMPLRNYDMRLCFNVDLKSKMYALSRRITSSQDCISFRVSTSCLIANVQLALSSLYRASLTHGSSSSRTLLNEFVVSLVSAFLTRFK